MAEQDFSEIAKLSERYGKDPKSRIFVQLADAYRKNNMVDEALEVLKKGLQYHPQYPLAHLIQGRCFFDKRLYSQAKESFDKVIKFDPQNIVALRMIAQVCETLRDEAGQIEAYKGLLAVDPTDAKAQEKLTALEAIQKKQSFFTITMAQEYERQGNLSESLKIYENLGFSDPSDFGIQEKIQELKQKLSSTNKVETPIQPKREEKVEGLEQFESYIKPHEIDFNAAPQPSMAEKAVISEMPEVKSDLPLAGIVEKTLETAPAEPVKPEEKKETADSDISKSDFVSSVTDFMLQETPTAPSKIEPMDLNKQEPAIAEPQKDAVPPIEEHPAEPVAEVAALSDLLVTEEKPTKIEEPPAETPPVKEGSDVLSISELLAEEPPVTVPSTPEINTTVPVEPEPAVTPVTEPVAPPTEEIMSINDLIETEPVAPTAEADSAATKPVETTPVEAAPTAAVEETAKPSENEPPPAATETKTEPAEEPKKQKEEDFKSFQDWLSGLLK
jgi:tetratricopeptide (TPR) repeat protein